MSDRTALLGSILVQDLLNPSPADVDVSFMRYRMETIVRFSGHPCALTLSEHHRLCEAIGCQIGSSEALIEWARHHDCHEFATGDLIRPLQRAIGADRLGEVQSRWDIAICRRLGIAEPTADVRAQVAEIDALALSIEWRHVLGRPVHELGRDAAALEMLRCEEVLAAAIDEGRREEMLLGRVLLAR